METIIFGCRRLVGFGWRFRFMGLFMGLAGWGVGGFRFRGFGGFRFRNFA